MPWLVSSLIVLALIVMYGVSLRRSWRRLEATVRPPDDLLRADDGYRFPDNDSTGGWV